ncbi:MAG TPA: TfoX/Sxy family protein [Polyangiaceae bacterium]|nr:TfoX/Sxy family protein [Polyangiaceae bacterium]
MVSKRSEGSFRAVPQDSMREWLEEVLAELPELSIRRLFGGAGLYSGETMFGALYQQRVYLKTDERTRPSFQELGSQALRARSGNVLTAYYELPASVQDDEHEFLSWARLALEVATREPARPRKRSHVDPEQILHGHPPEIRELARQAMALIRKEAPEASEAGYAGWHLIGYRAPHYFCFVIPLPEHVRLGFEHGQALPDPKHVLEPMGKQGAFVRLEPGKRIPRAALSSLIRAALEHSPPPRARRASTARRSPR